MSKLFLVLYFIISGLTCFGQAVQVSSTSLRCTAGLEPALKVNIPHVEPIEVEKEWKKFLKNKDAEVKINKGEIYADNALIAEITDNTIDVYSSISEGINKEGSILTVAIDLGGSFMEKDKHVQQFNKTEMLLKSFAVNLSTQFLQKKLNNANKELDRIQREKEKIEKTNEKLNAIIDENQQKIIDAKADLEKSQKELENNKKSMIRQQETIESIKKSLNALE